MFSKFNGLATGVAFAGVMAIGSPATQAAALNIMSLGDSITVGVGDGAATVDGLAGYRYYLQDLMNQKGLDYNFIGPYDNGSTFDPDGPGGIAPGFLSDGTTPFDTGHAGVSGIEADDLATDINNGGYFVDGVTPTAANVVLLHIGTNTITSSTSSDNTATAHLTTLLNELEDQWDSGNIASDAKIIVADIIPKAISGAATRETAQYNDDIDSVISTLNASFQLLFQRVDMFAIDINESWISDLTLSTAGQLNPENGDDTIDWTLGVNEADPIPSLPGSFTGFNSHLFNTDEIHPTRAGFEVMAHVWLNAIPEPGSVMLLLTGGSILVARRRRKAA